MPTEFIRRGRPVAQITDELIAAAKGLQRQVIRDPKSKLQATRKLIEEIEDLGTELVFWRPRPIIKKKDREILRHDVRDGYRNGPEDLDGLRDWLNRRQGKDLHLFALVGHEVEDELSSFASQTEECEALSRFIVDCAARRYIVASFAFDREDLDLVLTREGLEALRRLSAGTGKG